MFIMHIRRSHGVSARVEPHRTFGPDEAIAAWERLWNLFGFAELLTPRTAAWVRPDLSLGARFIQCRKIADLAKANLVKIFPQPMGSQVNLAAFVQFAAATPNYVLMEGQATVLDDLVDHPLRVDGGYVTVPDRPGIGLALCDEMLDSFPYRPHRIAPPLRAEGSVAH